jgi:hypothetical protein
MGILPVLRKYRPELKINPEIVEREKRFNEKNPGRINWMLDNTYLCTGGFKQLRQEENYKASPSNKLIHYPNYKEPKRVTIIGENKNSLEDQLKEAIFLRGCNAGVRYKILKKKGKFIAGAIPAIISSE